jgi:hypothetical protein
MYDNGMVTALCELEFFLFSVMFSNACKLGETNFSLILPKALQGVHGFAVQPFRSLLTKSVSIDFFDNRWSCASV